jgi:hypothetical protein
VVRLPVLSGKELMRGPGKERVSESRSKGEAETGSLPIKGGEQKGRARERSRSRSRRARGNGTLEC